MTDTLSYTVLEELQLDGLLNSIGAQPYVEKLQDLHEAGFRGKQATFTKTVAEDLGGLVSQAIEWGGEGAPTQSGLESVMRDRRLGRFQAPDAAANVYRGVVKAGLQEFYERPTVREAKPTFQERKAARSAALPFRTLPFGS